MILQLPRNYVRELSQHFQEMIIHNHPCTIMRRKTSETRAMIMNDEDTYTMEI